MIQQAESFDGASWHLKDNGTRPIAPGGNGVIKICCDAGLNAECITLCTLQLEETGLVHNGGFARIGNADGDANGRRGSIGTSLLTDLLKREGAIRQCHY